MDILIKSVTNAICSITGKQCIGATSWVNHRQTKDKYIVISRTVSRPTLTVNQVDMFPCARVSLKSVQLM